MKVVALAILISNSSTFGILFGSLHSQTKFFRLILLPSECIKVAILKAKPSTWSVTNLSETTHAEATGSVPRKSNVIINSGPHYSWFCHVSLRWTWYCFRLYAVLHHLLECVRTVFSFLRYHQSAHHVVVHITVPLHKCD